MRVLSSVYGGRGDVEPHVALAVALRSLGVDVQMCAPADCADRLAGVGLPLVPIGPDVRPLVQTGTRPTPADVPRIAAAIMAAQFERLAPAAAACDLIVASGLLPAAAAAHSVADTLGIPYVSAAYCPIYLPSPFHRPSPLPGHPLPADVTDNRALWALSAQHADALFGPALSALRGTAGLPPVADILAYVHGTNPLLAADPILGPWTPTDLDVLPTGAWILPDDRPLPDEVLRFLAAGAPPVYVGFGSMGVAGRFAPLVLDAVRDAGHRVLVSRGWADLSAPGLRDDTLVIGEVNHQALFPRVAAVVHHGGAGTTTAAARAGVPQVVIPQMADQPYWAGRVAALGIGVAHHDPTPTAASLTEALTEALASETRVRAAAFASEIRADGALVAAKRLVAQIENTRRT